MKKKNTHKKNLEQSSKKLLISIWMRFSIFDVNIYANYKTGKGSFNCNKWEIGLELTFSMDNYTSLILSPYICPIE